MAKVNYALFAVFVFVQAAFLAQFLRADTTNPTTATINYQGPVTQTDGFTFAASATATNYAAEANWPAAFAARYSASERAKTRWITIRNLDSAITVCVAVGASGVGSDLQCDPDDSSSGAARTTGLLLPGQSVQILLGSAASLGISSMPDIWIASESGNPRVSFDAIF